MGTISRLNVVYIYGPIFAAYQQHGNLTFRALMGRCLDLLLPERSLEADAPPSAEVSLTRQGSRDSVHIVNYHADRRAPAHVEALEEPVALRDVALSLRRSSPTTRVKLVRAKAELPFEAAAGVVCVMVPRVAEHELVVVEGDD